MKRNIVLHYLILTFAIMLVSWGSCVIAGYYGITQDNNLLMYIPYLVGGFSPTIASYVVLKKHGRVSGFKQWLRTIFNVKAPVRYYIFVVAMCALFVLTNVLLSGMEELKPLYLILLYLPVMLVGGGLEEAGWRYVLSPELDRKYGFVLSSVITGVIWAAWHIPLFFMPDTTQNSRDFWLFSISVMGFAFALGAIRQITDNVFLCVFFHCLINAVTGVIIFNQTFVGIALSTGIVIAVSLVAYYRHKKHCKEGIVNV